MLTEAIKIKLPVTRDEDVHAAPRGLYAEGEGRHVGQEELGARRLGPVQYGRLQVQKDQLNMSGFFWYLVKSDLSIVHYSTRVHWTSHFYQKTTVMLNW